MPRKRQIELNEATQQAIKDTARQLMAEKGTAGLSLRAIARNLEMTAPALYHYFSSLDDLITALIVDAFTSHADYVQMSRDAAAQAGDSYSEQVFAAAIAFRQWVLDNPIDFQLVYGNPIPGYKAPGEVTTPAARKMGPIFMETLVAGIQSGDVQLSKPLLQAPPPIRRHYLEEIHIPDEAVDLFHTMNYVWATMHGIIALEAYNHAGPVIGDVDTFYRQVLKELFSSLGLKLA
ncbi:MAG: TetR/AcrR family transcriptional regulator [Chloroflexota bacterium]